MIDNSISSDRDSKAARNASSSEEPAFIDGALRLELATSAAGIGIWDWNLITGRMDYSLLAKEISGFAPDEEVTIEKVRAIVHPDDYPRTSAIAAGALDPDVRSHDPYEYRIILPDGSFRWVLAHGRAVYEESGGVHRAVRYLGTIQDVTERRQLETSIRAAEQRLALAIEAGRMAVWEVDIKEDRLIGTPELNRLLGFPEGETLDIETLRKHYYPGERERMQEMGQKNLARGEKQFETEFRYVRPDGNLIWLMLRTEIHYDGSGTPQRAVGVLMDITERKLTEEALSANEAKLKLALQAAGAGVFEWDLEQDRLEWSPELYELFGIDAEVAGDDLREAWRTMVHPADYETSLAAGMRAVEEGGSFATDFRITRSDGDIRWIRSRGTAVPGPDGKAVKLTGIDLDVTVQNRAAELLLDRAEKTERERNRIYELSSDLFGYAGFDGRLREINPAWERVLGFSRDELLSVEFIERIHPQDRASTAEIIGMLRSGGEIRHFENRVIGSDGRDVWISWSAVSEKDFFYVVGRDVTREKERDEALRQAQKMEAVGQLTGGIAHDFNNLLQAMRGNFDLIRRGVKDDKLRRWAENGAAAAERGARLTSQLLAFSRAQKLEMKEVDLAHLLGEMDALLTRTLGPSIRIGLSLPDEGISVLADPTQLEMAILNLAINARDAMPEGGELTIGARLGLEAEEHGLETGDYVAVEVADTGTGMEPEVAKRAFDPFYTTKGVGKGTGLGLSQVYGMTRQAGGGAKIKSVPGRGTIVTMYLQSIPSTGPHPVRKQAPSAGHVTAASLVLVVDDDPGVRHLLVDTLSDAGYSVLEAADGEQALELLKDERPDLMIVDYAMPGISGAEVADKVRESYPDMPILFASGYADTGAIEAAAGPGATLLRKPFRVDELESAVAAALAD